MQHVPLSLVNPSWLLDSESFRRIEEDRQTLIRFENMIRLFIYENGTAHRYLYNYFMWYRRLLFRCHDRVGDCVRILAELDGTGQNDYSINIAKDVHQERLIYLTQIGSSARLEEDALFWLAQRDQRAKSLADRVRKSTYSRKSYRTVVEELRRRGDWVRLVKAMNECKALSDLMVDRTHTYNLMDSIARVRDDLTIMAAVWSWES